MEILVSIIAGIISIGILYGIIMGIRDDARRVK